MALRALVKGAELQKGAEKSSVAQLYRSIIKEIPRVLILYDVDMPLKTAKSAIRYHFRQHKFLKDGRIIGLLLAKGYMELEETLMQWKQKTHLLRILEVPSLEPKKLENLTAAEKLILNID
mmetsp:Transcript_17249/g.24991  ORF Transcript_17249/g.24991 Transcript_17249/m.24991 type:complete len:121 (-) Transcript_17249:91-453(-)